MQLRFLRDHIEAKNKNLSIEIGDHAGFIVSLRPRSFY